MPRIRGTGGHMKIGNRIAFTAIALLAMSSQAVALTTTRQSVRSNDDAKLGSVYLRCDGLPPHQSGADIAARIVLIMATAGLAGPGEQADTSKRLTGAEAVSACDKAIASESDPIRKVQLTLARAVHHIETKNYEAALADARSAPALAGNDANELGFQHSLMLSSLDLEAAALVRLNRPAEAEAVAIRMAATSPYDVIAQQRAMQYAGLTANMSPEKKEYLDRFARLSPTGLFLQAEANEWIGNYLESAADYEAYLDNAKGFATEKDPAAPQPAVEARRAVALALGGDMKLSNAVAAEARKTVDELVRTGKALNMQNVISVAEELLDFQAIVAKLDAGDVVQARAAFAGRTRWLTPTPAAIAELTARLSKGAKPGELTGALLRDPAEIRASGLTAELGSITGATNADTSLYAAIRSPMSADEYRYWNDDIRDTEDSDFLLKKTGKETYLGDVIYMKRSNGIATGDALLMHCALLARARGKTGFVIFPARKRLDMAIVRFGNPGDPGFPARATMDAATVITALSPEFQPKPPRKVH